MNICAAFGVFVLLIGPLAADDSASVKEPGVREVESPLHNLVKRSSPANYGYKATGNVKVGAPVVLKAPVFKEVAAFVANGFKYIYPNKGGKFQGGNFNRGSGYPYGHYPNAYPCPGGYPYGYGAGFPYFYQSGNAYAYKSGNQFSSKGINPSRSGFNRPIKGFGANKVGY